MNRQAITTQDGFAFRSIQTVDIPLFVSYWNEAFAERRNFTPLTPALFSTHIESCPAYDPAGLILTWVTDENGQRRIAGFIHALRPPPQMLVYTRWGRHHSIAALHVAPQYRRQGLGSQLLRMAEDWLYRCPIHFGGQSTPCYGGVEGPRPPFYGSTQRMGISVTETELLRFLSNRRYTIVEPGDISLTANLTKNPARQADAKALTNGLRLERVDHSLPFPYTEPANRREYESWLQLTDSPYAGVLLINSRNELCGHLCWYPMRSADRAGIYAFWLEPALRGQGLGALLLDTALADMACETQLGGPFSYVEVQSHSVRHAVAVQLYESRGFQIDDAWVNLVKT